MVNVGGNHIHLLKCSLSWRRARLAADREHTLHQGKLEGSFKPQGRLATFGSSSPPLFQKVHFSLSAHTPRSI